MSNTVHHILFGGNMHNHNNVVNLLIKIKTCQYVKCYVHSPCSLTTISKDTHSCRHRTREDTHIIVCIGQSREALNWGQSSKFSKTRVSHSLTKIVPNNLCLCHHPKDFNLRSEHTSWVVYRSLILRSVS